MEFTNLLHKHARAGAAAGLADAVDRLLLLMAPMTPHVTAELWDRRHPGQHVHAQAWPSFDPALAAALTETMVVQVDGKVRDRIEVEAGVGEAEMRRLALASAKVQAALAGAPPSKVIARPPRLLNLVR
jgi:leucyl-tRNA synthetase